MKMKRRRFLKMAMLAGVAGGPATKTMADARIAGRRPVRWFFGGQRVGKSERAIGEPSLKDLIRVEMGKFKNATGIIAHTRLFRLLMDGGQYPHMDFRRRYVDGVEVYHTAVTLENSFEILGERSSAIRSGLETMGPRGYGIIQIPRELVESWEKNHV